MDLFLEAKSLLKFVSKQDLHIGKALYGAYRFFGTELCKQIWAGLIMPNGHLLIYAWKLKNKLRWFQKTFCAAGNHEKSASAVLSGSSRRVDWYRSLLKILRIYRLTGWLPEITLSAPVFVLVVGFSCLKRQNDPYDQGFCSLRDEPHISTPAELITKSLNFTHFFHFESS